MHAHAYTHTYMQTQTYVGIFKHTQQTEGNQYTITNLHTGVYMLVYMHVCISVSLHMYAFLGDFLYARE